MAILLVNHVGAGGPGTNVTTAAIDTTGATFLVVAVSNLTSVAAAAISDSKSNTWVPLTAYALASHSRAQLIYCVTPTVGSGHTFTATTVGFPSIVAMAFVGVAATSPFDVENGTTNSTSTGSITPTQDHELIVCATVNESSNSWGTVNGLAGIANSVTNDGVNFSCVAGYGIQGTAAAVNLTFSGGTMSSPTSVVASFKAA